MTCRVLAAASIVLLALLGLTLGAREIAQAHTVQRTVRSASQSAMGPMMMVTTHAWLGYYDSNKYTYISTDVSNKAQAKAMHINYSAAIGAVHNAPKIYLVQGRAAPHQLAVFGSYPAAPDYSPLWTETNVSFKAGVKPVLLTSDNHINALAAKGKLKAVTTTTILNVGFVRIEGRSSRARRVSEPRSHQLSRTHPSQDPPRPRHGSRRG
jgi:hypothetical protein